MTLLRSLKKERQSRGQTLESDDFIFEQYHNDKLMQFLSDNSPRARTSAAKILGKRKYYEAIKLLCTALKIEKQLYSKIAISEALSNMGTLAINPLIRLIGDIGTNQETKLPLKGFYKNNYPLPRDIASRSLIRIGTVALPELMKVLSRNNLFKIEQAIDAIGHISFYSKNHLVLPQLIYLYDKHKNSEMILWKLIRSFSAFHDSHIFSLLNDHLLNSFFPSIRWEAARSLGIIRNSKSLILLNKATNDNHPEVIKMAILAIENIKNSIF